MEDYKKIFQMDDVEVPEVVMQKANDAFSQIKKEGTSKMNDKLEKKKHFYSKRAAAAAAIAILTAGSVTTIAATHHIWSRGMQGTLQATDEQQQTLTDQGVATVMQEQEDYTQLGVTDGNVTITPETVISDERFVYLSFEVSGYTIGEEIEPCFGGVSVYQGEDSDAVNSVLNMSGSFYDGIIADENGSPVYEDGTELQYTDTGEIVSHYADENGNLEYVIIAMVADQDDTLLGKTVHVAFTNLGTVYKADYENTLNGNWSFDIELPSVSAAKTMQIHQELAGTAYTLDTIELSPVSIELNYSVNGEVMVSEDENGVPNFCGVVLKDGTRIPFLANGGSTGYTDDTMAEAYEWSGFDRVLSIDQVDALLIRLEGNDELVEIPIL
jgi:hypothetical protein